MESAVRVLLIGNDLDHLSRKTDVLRHFWHVETAAPQAASLAHVDAEVAVVCITLPDGERQRCIEDLREQRPTLVLVKMNGFNSGPHAGADAIIDEAHGPGALVSAIYQLLTERGLPSRGWPAHVNGPLLQ